MLNIAVKLKLKNMKNMKKQLKDYKDALSDDPNNTMLQWLIADIESKLIKN